MTITELRPNPAIAGKEQKPFSLDTIKSFIQTKAQAALFLAQETFSPVQMSPVEPPGDYSSLVASLTAQRVPHTSNIFRRTEWNRTQRAVKIARNMGVELSDKALRRFLSVRENNPVDDDLAILQYVLEKN